MRKALLVLTLCLPLSGHAADSTALSEEARRLIIPLQQALQNSVQQAMQQGGPLQAVASCQVQAPILTAAHSPSPWQVGRTALRLRNPANQPDAWEQEVLQRFAARAAAGEPLAGKSLLIGWEAGHGDMIQFVRYAQVLREQKPRSIDLVCHPPLLPLFAKQGGLGIDRVFAFDAPLPDGGCVLVFVSDNNFNPAQVTQFIAAQYLGPDGDGGQCGTTGASVLSTYP